MFLYKLFNDLPAPYALSVETKRFKLKTFITTFIKIQTVGTATTLSET